MEILFEEILWVNTIFYLVAATSILGFFTYAWIRDYKETREKVYLVCALATGLIMIGLVILVTFKTPTQVLAKVTDIDEVYENGYEIVRRQGENYIIRKR